MKSWCRLLTYLTCLTYAASAAAMPDKPLHYVSDFAGILDQPVEDRLNARIKGLQDLGKAEIAVVTVGSLEGMGEKEYANRLFKSWGVGKRGKDNGVLILVAPNERKMWIEVGYGLEAVLPDGLSGEIVRSEFIPAFKRGDYPGGIAAGTERVARTVEGDAPVRKTAWHENPYLHWISGGMNRIWDFVLEWLFFSIFVGCGAFLFGGGIGGKKFMPFIFGLLFTGIPFWMAAEDSPLLALFLIPVGIGFFWLGFLIGKKNPHAFEGNSSGGSSCDFGGGGGGSFGGGGGGSDFGGFGGGSSGGGGAGGSW